MPEETIVQAITADLRDNAKGCVRALTALAAYRTVPQSIVQSANTFLESLTQLGEDAVPPLPGPKKISYFDLDAREAAVLDIVLFGERTIDEIQSSVFSHGFEHSRTGQIRSSINAKANRGVIFDVHPGERVSLLPEGVKLAERLKKRFNM